MTQTNQITAITMTMALALVAAALPAAAQTTPAEAPHVSVTRAAGGRVVVEVAEPGVTIRKEITADASHVLITTPKDELQLRVARGQLAISTPAGTMTVTGGQAAEMSQLMTMLRQSDAAVRGLALLKRVPATTRNFGQQALLLTRAVLELGAGSSHAVSIHRRLAEQERGRLQATRPQGMVVTRVSLADDDQGKGPGDCWDLYAQEAVRIADDFADCADDLKWYDVLGWAGCSLVYAVRSEGAMAWYIACNGGMPFKG